MSMFFSKHKCVLVGMVCLSLSAVLANCLAPTAAMAQETPAAKSAASKKGTAKAAQTPNPALAQIEDQPGLPRVLLIGDSISMGYTLDVREELKGKANVHRPPTNCGPTTNGLANLDKWLGDKPWDVIHFNWGLHDLKYIDSKGAMVSPKQAGAVQQVPPDQYEKNLTELVSRLKKTGAKLIWCATTPVPEGATGRIADDSAKFNAIAAKVMQEHGVEINDLHAFAAERLKEIQQPANVHFSAAGSKVLASQVAQRIRAALPQPK